MTAVASRGNSDGGVYEEVDRVRLGLIRLLKSIKTGLPVSLDSETSDVRVVQHQFDFELCVARHERVSVSGLYSHRNKNGELMIHVK